MPTEQFANRPATTLNGSILAGASTLVVASAVGFSTSPNFRIIVDSGANLEYMLVTGVAGLTFTVVRGIEGTVAVPHAGGVTIVQGLTAGAIAQLKADTLASQVSAAPDPFGEAGTTFNFPSTATRLSQGNPTEVEGGAPVASYVTTSATPLAVTNTPPLSANGVGFHTYEVGAVVFSGGAPTGDFWHNFLKFQVATIAGTPTIYNATLGTADVNDTGSGITAATASASVVGGNIVISVTGVAATTVKWTVIRQVANVG